MNASCIDPMGYGDRTTNQEGDMDMMSQQDYAGGVKAMTRPEARDADYGGVLQQRQRLDRLCDQFAEELGALVERLQPVLVLGPERTREDIVAQPAVRCTLADVFAGDLDRLEVYLGRLGDLRRSIDI